MEIQSHIMIQEGNGSRRQREKVAINNLTTDTLLRKEGEKFWLSGRQGDDHQDNKEICMISYYLRDARTERACEKEMLSSVSESRTNNYNYDAAQHRVDKNQPTNDSGWQLNNESQQSTVNRSVQKRKKLLYCTQIASKSNSEYDDCLKMRIKWYRNLGCTAGLCCFKV